MVLVALNEQANIESALQSVSWAADIVVYDSGSVDKTMDIARKTGANVIQGPWAGFGKTKKLATDYAKLDWVLSLDCDEVVSQALQQEIRSRFEQLRPDTVYRLPRSSFYLNRWIKYGGWYPDLQGRLFNRKNTNWNEASIHEKVEAQNYENFTTPLNHYVFKNIEEQVKTNNRYSSLQAQEMLAAGKKFSWFHFFTKPLVKFIECYLIKRGFLDGIAGYIIAYNASYSVFLKWAKLLELEMKKI